MSNVGAIITDDPLVISGINNKPHVFLLGADSPSLIFHGFQSVPGRTI